MQVELLAYGLCVGDIERSAAFYASAFGFGALEPIAPDALPTPAAGEQILRHGRIRDRRGTGLDLIATDAPPPPRAGLFSKPGISNLTVYETEMERMSGPMVEAGGVLIETSRVRPDPAFEAMFACDPDGIDLEPVAGAGRTPGLARAAVCVRDLAAAERLYNTLGFVSVRTLECEDAPVWLGQLSSTSGMALRALIMSNPKGANLELITPTGPRLTEGAVPAGPITLGPSHLLFGADDVDRLAANLVVGGALLKTATAGRRAELTDPDGVRIVITALGA